jgi:ribonuclease BN (tRNA processing enzyme)
VKLAGIKFVCLLGTAGEEYAGLPGLVCSLSGAGAPTLRIFGPAGTEAVVKSTAVLLNKRYPELTPASLELEKTEQSACFCLDEGEDPNFDLRCGVVAVPAESCSESSISATKRTKLAQGNSCERSRRRYLTIYRCTAKHGDGPSFVVLSCRTCSDARALADHALLRGAASFVFHLTPSDVMCSAEYGQLLGRCGSAQHIAVNSFAGGCVYQAATRLTNRLNSLAPAVFPLPVCHSNSSPPENAPPQVVQGTPLLVATLLPEAARGIREPPQQHPPQLQESVESDAPSGKMESPGLSRARKEVNDRLMEATRSSCSDNASAAVLLKQKLGLSSGRAEAASSLVSPSYDKIYFLGTGSAAPSRLRGSSGILLHAEGFRLLMDAGEGTFGNLSRQFGHQGAIGELRALDAIWISHHHSDHTSGLWRLLCERGPDAPLIPVVAPPSVLAWLEGCSSAAPQSTTYLPIDITRQKGASFPAATIQSVPVLHCRDAFGIVIMLRRSSKTVVYSGDTRPCEALIRAGKFASLLIHEATFDDSMGADAKSKRHCTVGEAVRVAQQMHAGGLILTHFSQRYPSLPPQAQAASEEGVIEASPLFAVAFDGMVAPLGGTAALADLAHNVIRPALLSLA